MHLRFSMVPNVRIPDGIYDESSPTLCLTVAAIAVAFAAAPVPDSK